MDRQVLCVGETMALVVPEDGRPLRSTRNVLLTHAGAESNVARYLADLGLPVAWVSALGQDALGDRIVDDLAGAGVDVRWVTRSTEAPTGVFFKDPSAAGTRVLYFRSGSAASRLGPADVAGWPVATARWLHLSGITPALSVGAAAMTQELVRRAGAAGVPWSFDVNHRPALWSGRDAAAELADLARRATVVLVGLDEAAGLWGTQTAEEVGALLAGPDVVVVKDGAHEAVELDRRTGQITRVPARRVRVTEPVGAGDAFAAGYLAGHLRGEDAPGRLTLAHSLAAWTLGTPSDHRPGHGPVPRPVDEEIL
ncbi:sugar kinase [Georgenia muralis]|uniref:2-dehydro-3-deoxygluconokinase n=1 Tax=Georgenia muralis TaxID=154117 RepID=A0A3N4Z530_9MICO|nr:sugar kinase [Georgenia muralis]RPF27034.1 2-dehydro-3-deoxygluconokinase [Georgenia muralis]